ncbi:hypothetical protein SRB5_44490 [Streptomyces sp. RB5]|uniref:LamG-like jellyroll fold domain-containing protein n=1 Tax=Streptomyces smaragdinus TaxID=2585196 RepID=A0A7K0CLC5_9ACTN|nr:LamG domain-containing protein [Streptomyces smaragdinus]MQY14286.1 hypothetical protein [Streptomyces smaragdinus]
MASSGRTRALVVTTLAALTVALAPAQASAAENRPPDQPVAAELTTGFRSCASGAKRPYVNSRPTLRAVLRDQDYSARVSAQFEISWRDEQRTRQVRTYDTTEMRSGSEFSMPLSDEIPGDTVIDWRVRAFDGEVWGPWSDADDLGRCEFVYDPAGPASPVVTSAEYPEGGDTWSGGVGERGHFTLDSPSDDVVAYVYYVAGDADHVVETAGPGDPVTVDWVPQRAGTAVLYAQAVDRAGTASAPATYLFRVGSARAPVAAWRLADPAGSTQAAPDAGEHPAVAGDGVTFGAAGPSGTPYTVAAELDGSAGAYLAPGVQAVDTGDDFSVSAWVSPSSTGDAAAVSRDGDGGAAFALGTHTGADGVARWSFGLPDSRSGDVVRAEGGAASAGEWTHLTGVYDAEKDTATLYVNGSVAGDPVTVRATKSPGDLQLGRALDAGAYGHHWAGALADVRVWDRMVVAPEVPVLAERVAVRRGYWQLNAAPGGVVPEYDGGQPLRLGGGASVYTGDSAACVDPYDPLCPSPDWVIAGSGHLVLHGDGDYAATDAPVIDTSRSWSLSMLFVVPETPDRDMALLSLPGEHTNAVDLRWDGAEHRVRLTVAHEDSAEAETTTLFAAGLWDHQPSHVGAVYDASADELRLYVNGELRSTVPLAGTDAWRATGGLQVGRTSTAGIWGDWLTGSVDEVRAFEGAVTDTQMAAMSNPMETPDV